MGHDEDNHVQVDAGPSSVEIADELAGEFIKLIQPILESDEALKNAATNLLAAPKIYLEYTKRHFQEKGEVSINQLNAVLAKNDYKLEVILLSRAFALGGENGLKIIKEYVEKRANTKQEMIAAELEAKKHPVQPPTEIVKDKMFATDAMGSGDPEEEPDDEEDVEEEIVERKTWKDLLSPTALLAALLSRRNENTNVPLEIKPTAEFSLDTAVLREVMKRVQAGDFSFELIGMCQDQLVKAQMALKLDRPENMAWNKKVKEAIAILKYDVVGSIAKGQFADILSASNKYSREMDAESRQKYNDILKIVKTSDELFDQIKKHVTKVHSEAISTVNANNTEGKPLDAILDDEYKQKLASSVILVQKLLAEYMNWKKSDNEPADEEMVYKIYAGLFQAFSLYGVRVK